MLTRKKQTPEPRLQHLGDPAYGMALAGDQVTYNATLSPGQDNPHIFATLDDDLVPLA